MVSEKEYLRKKRYRANHADELAAYHKAWQEQHREEWNAYMREYRFRRKFGVPADMTDWRERHAPD